MSITIFTSHKFSIDECPPNLKQNLEKWRLLNSTYNFKYYDDRSMNLWMETNTDKRTYKLYNKLNSGAGQADLFRVCHLYKNGGIWVDADLPAFNIEDMSPNFQNLLIENRAVIVRNRKCNNPRYTFMASTKDNLLFLRLNDFINEQIEMALKTQSKLSTIHITGPFTLHKLLCLITGLRDITHLGIDEPYQINGSFFIYIDDIVPEKSTYEEENVYKGYKEDLKFMGITPHDILQGVKRGSNL